MKGEGKMALRWTPVPGLDIYMKDGVVSQDWGHMRGTVLTSPWEKPRWPTSKARGRLSIAGPAD